MTVSWNAAAGKTALAVPGSTSTRSARDCQKHLKVIYPLLFLFLCCSLFFSLFLFHYLSNFHILSFFYFLSPSFSHSLSSYIILFPFSCLSSFTSFPFFHSFPSLIVLIHFLPLASLSPFPFCRTLSLFARQPSLLSLYFQHRLTSHFTPDKGAW